MRRRDLLLCRPARLDPRSRKPRLNFAAVPACHDGRRPWGELPQTIYMIGAIVLVLAGLLGSGGLLGVNLIIGILLGGLSIFGVSTRHRPGRSYEVKARETRIYDGDAIERATCPTGRSTPTPAPAETAAENDQQDDDQNDPSGSAHDSSFHTNENWTPPYNTVRNAPCRQGQCWWRTASGWRSPPRSAASGRVAGSRVRIHRRRAAPEGDAVSPHRK